MLFDFFTRGSKQRLAECRHQILLVGTADRRPDFSPIYQAIALNLDIELLILSKRQLKRLSATLEQINLSAYSLVLLDVPFKYASTCRKKLRSIRNLLIYEQDACQEFIDASKWSGQFSDFYRSLNFPRVIVTGANIADRLRGLGADAIFVPKGYDESILYEEQLKERDILLGFVGSVTSEVYELRKQLLDGLRKSCGLQIMRAQYGSPYRRLLNRVQVFVSADIGIGEYMAKNFEAMACGCAVLAFRQGGVEEEALGFCDMENVALYSSLDEAKEKIAILKNDSELRNSIAIEGRKLVQSSYSFGDMTRSIIDEVTSQLKSGDKTVR